MFTKKLSFAKIVGQGAVNSSKKPKKKCPYYIQCKHTGKYYFAIISTMKSYHNPVLICKVKHGSCHVSSLTVEQDNCLHCAYNSVLNELELYPINNIATMVIGAVNILYNVDTSLDADLLQNEHKTIHRIDCDGNYRMPNGDNGGYSIIEGSVTANIIRNLL
jgi:hypothetical protein